MTAFKLLLIGLGFGWGAWQESATFNSGGSRVILTNADSGNVTGMGEGTKEKHVSMTGNPVQIHSPEKGFTARGKTLDFTWAELNPQTMEFRNGRIEGSASVIFDSSVSQKALEEDAKSQHKPAPPPSPETTFIQSDSELFTYVGDVNKGTLTMPGAWKVKQLTHGSKASQSDGKTLQVVYDQVFDASGSSGNMSVVKGKDGALSQLETGYLEGPVHFKITRTETTEGESNPKISIYTGVADHVKLNLQAQPGTVTAEGNVKVDADLGGYLSHFSDDTFIFFVNEKLEPMGFQFYGKPGVTTAKAKDGGK